MTNRLNFEQSLARLSEISAAMNDSNLALEDSLKLYGEAVGLIDICKRRIESAKLEITKIESGGTNTGGNESESGT
ncbi:MAG: exodeoxyribonuclease VII small subunit [Oscillospiraceae bacterium]|nr:exodeoxyribonuclease VII small subunit [Oscillospiraceae bacterium]